MLTLADEVDCFLTDVNKRLVRLADFGLARACESSRISGLTMQGEIGGAPAFMASEHVTTIGESRTRCTGNSMSPFGEDRNRITKRHPAENLALLRRQTLSLLKAHPSKLSIAKKRFAAGLDTEFLEEILKADGMLEKP